MKVRADFVYKNCLRTTPSALLEGALRVELLIQSTRQTSIKCSVVSYMNYEHKTTQADIEPISFGYDVDMSTFVNVEPVYQYFIFVHIFLHQESKAMSVYSVNAVVFLYMCI